MRHQALNVFQHHNGVIDHNADGKRHGKKRERIQRKPEKPETCHGADQRHRNRKHGNKGGTPVLQEEKDHKQHENTGFNEGLKNFGERSLHKDRRVIGDLVLDFTGRILFFQTRKFPLHFLGRCHGVGAGLQVNAHGDGGLTLKDV